MSSSSPFGSVPPVLKNLVILNGLAFLAQFVFRRMTGAPFLGPVEWWGALWPLGMPVRADLPVFYPWQLVTYGFLHADFWHLAFNMYGLFLFGSNVERSIGSKRFAVLFGAGLLVAAVAQLALVTWSLSQGGGIVPTVGASGGVLGVIVAAAILFPRAEIFMFPLPVPIQLRWLALFYVASDVLGVVGVGGAGVANIAHLGGAAAGALLLLYWQGRLPVRPRSRIA